MKYLLLLYADESLGANFTPEERQSLMQAWYAYMKEAEASGALIANNGILPSADATTVRVREGKTMITDGPFAETHEQLGGYAVFDCQDLDEAIRWAEKIPTVKYGSIEIRPLWTPDS